MKTFDTSSTAIARTKAASPIIANSADPSRIAIVSAGRSKGDSGATMAKTSSAIIAATAERTAMM